MTKTLLTMATKTHSPIHILLAIMPQCAEIYILSSIEIQNNKVPYSYFHIRMNAV